MACLELFENWLLKNGLKCAYAFNIMPSTSASVDPPKYTCDLFVDGLNYIGRGLSYNEDGALYSAIVDYINFLVQSGYISPDELPRYENIDDGDTMTSNKLPPTIVNSNIAAVFPQIDDGDTMTSNEVCRACVHPETQSAFMGNQTRQIDDGDSVTSNKLPPTIVNSNIAAVFPPKVVVPEEDPCQIVECEKKQVGDDSNHGNWTIDNAKSRLNQFFQVNQISTEYHITIAKAEYPMQFMAVKAVEIPQINKVITCTGYGPSKQSATKDCALSIVNRLVLLGLIEPFSNDRGKEVSINEPIYNEEQKNVIIKFLNLFKIFEIQKLIGGRSGGECSRSLLDSEDQLKDLLDVEDQLKKYDNQIEPSSVECSRSHLDWEQKLRFVENMISFASLPSHQFNLALNLFTRLVELGQKSLLSDSIDFGIIKE